VQEDAKRSVATLRDRGWQPRVLSGDHPRLVREVARRIGLEETEVEGGASPERKADVVANEVQRERNVVMVGDGVNDAAALSAATVGVAVHGGAEASLAAADVFIRRPGLEPLVSLFDGARRTVGVIRRNIVVSLFYNLITGSLAMAGLINPLIAAVLMPLSSLTVVTLSYRSRTFTD
jgi:Cu2+-exporting ATPase